MRYTPTQAPAYWVHCDTITRLEKPPPFPLQKSVVNGMYALDCLMVGPGALVLRTPSLDEFKPCFRRVEFKRIFGRLDVIPNSYLLATNVEAMDPEWEPSEYARLDKPCGT